jgi:hypothetical protein
LAVGRRALPPVAQKTPRNGTPALAAAATLCHRRHKKSPIPFFAASESVFFKSNNNVSIKFASKSEKTGRAGQAERTPPFPLLPLSSHDENTILRTAQ